MGTLDPLKPAINGICPLCPAHLVGLGAFQAAFLLGFIDLRLAAVPLALFVFACLTAPFNPRSGFFLPVISRGVSSLPAVALSFDDGPDPEITPRLIDVLQRYNVTACFFVNGQKAERHPDIIRKLLAQGHMIGNHTYSHDNLIMFKDLNALKSEIERVQDILAEFGVQPLAFRPPVGVTWPLLRRALLECGLFCVNFSCRARDLGNRRIRDLGLRLLKKARQNDILLLHDVRPKGDVHPEEWFAQIEILLKGLPAKGLRICPLQDLIQKPVMRKTNSATALNPVQTYYAGLAPNYDAGPRTPIQKTERQLFAARFEQVINTSARVLEIGAGTGVYSLPIAQKCKRLLANDISIEMLSRLQEQADRENINNLDVLAGDVEALELKGEFDVICAFSTFEYIRDLGALFKSLAPHLAPGGIIWFTTAHASIYRLVVQIGNALRQGVWLKARRKSPVYRQLRTAGLSCEHMATHVCKMPLLGGMLLEVVARRPANPDNRRASNTEAPRI